MTEANFTPQLFRFMNDLAANNDREWFKANKKRYEQYVKEPALQFIADFDGPLRTISPHFRAIPKAQGGSLFRIFRDTRFSNDKSPYKTHTGIHFRHEVGKDAHAPGFYLHLQPGEVMIGVGMWMPDPPTLAAIRDAIVADPGGWTKVKRQMHAAGYQWMTDEKLKRVPRGYDADHEHVEDLKLKSFAVGKTLTEGDAVAPGFSAQVADGFAGAAPLVAFLCKAVNLPF